MEKQMSSNENQNEERRNFIVNALVVTCHDEADIAGPERIEHIASAALSRTPFHKAFDTARRGAPDSILEILQILLLSAQSILAFVEIWERARRKLSRSEFLEQAEQSIPTESRPQKWREFIEKVYELLRIGLM
jgi:hypothetical protein